MEQHCHRLSWDSIGRNAGLAHRHVRQRPKNAVSDDLIERSQLASVSALGNVKIVLLGRRTKDEAFREQLMAEAAVSDALTALGQT